MLTCKLVEYKEPVEFVYNCFVTLDLLWLILPGPKIFHQLKHYAIPTCSLIISPKPEQDALNESFRKH